jgi:hypothetical protein
MRDESNTPSEEDATEFLPDDGSGLLIARGSSSDATPGQILIVAYDVTGLTEDEIDYLAGEAIVQGEASDADPEFGVVGHPNAPYVGTDITTLEHLRTALPDFGKEL